MLPGVDPRDSLTDIIIEQNVTIPASYVPTNPQYLEVAHFACSLTLRITVSLCMGNAALPSALLAYTIHTYIHT